jgi:hypothetical protein
LKRLSSDLSAAGKVSSFSNTNLTVEGGVWILETEPYNVPVPGETD